MAQGQKTKLFRLLSTGPDVYEQMAGVVSLGDDDQTREAVDETVMEHTSPYMVKEAAALIDPGDLEVTLKFVPGSDAEQKLHADFLAGTSVQYKIEIPNGAGVVTSTFMAFISSWGKTTPNTERMTRRVTFTKSGAPADDWIV